MSTPKRRYDSPLRRQRAAETRLRIVESAADVFTAHGYGGATLAMIAEGAGVAVDSVRATGSKAFLLLEGFRLRYAGPGGWQSVLEQESVQDIFGIDDPDEGLVAAIEFLASGHARSARLWVAVRAAALTYPEVAEGFAELSRLKEESFLVTTRWLLQIGLVEPVADDELRSLAAAVSFTMSAETYLLLTDDYGLGDDGYRAWLARAVPRLRP